MRPGAVVAGLDKKPAIRPPRLFALCACALWRHGGAVRGRGVHLQGTLVRSSERGLGRKVKSRAGGGRTVLADGHLESQEFEMKTPPLQSQEWSEECSWSGVRSAVDRLANDTRLVR